MIERMHAENQPEITRPYGLSRRDMVLLAASGVALLRMGYRTGQEVQDICEGTITTADGLMHPYYERHEHHTAVQESIPLAPNIPYFAELPLIDQLLTQNPLAELILVTAEGRDTNIPSRAPIFSDAFLKNAAHHQMPLLFGDLNLQKIASETQYQGESYIKYAEAYIGYLSGLFLFALLKDDLEFNQPYSRRAVLKSIVGFLTGYPLLSLMQQSTAVHSLFTDMYDTTNNTKRRAIARIYGMLSMLSPANINIFVRNAYLAHKLLFYLHQAASDGEKVPELIYQVHGNHSGIEDFVHAGKAFCEFILLALPQALLTRFVAGAGGLQAFCSVRFITLTEDFNVTRIPAIHPDRGGVYWKVKDISGDIAVDVVLTDQEFLKQVTEKIPLRARV